MHLDEIATKAAPGAPLLIRRLAWHQNPRRSEQRLSPTAAAARTRTERQENIWQFLRQNWPSNRIFKSFDDIHSSINPGRSCPSRDAT